MKQILKEKINNLNPKVREKLIKRLAAEMVEKKDLKKNIKK